MHGIHGAFSNQKNALGSTIGWDFSHIISDFSHLGSLERRILSPRSTSVLIPMSRVNWWSKKPPVRHDLSIWNQKKLQYVFCRSVFFWYISGFSIVKEKNHRFQYEALARSWTQDFSDHQDDVTISRLKRKQLNHCRSISKKKGETTLQQLAG